MIYSADFFRLNMPYGMIRKEGTNEWMFFNRYYKPLGFSTDKHIHYEEYPVYQTYKNLNDKFLIKIAHGKVAQNDNGPIFQVWFYDDATNPMNDAKCWNQYFEKLKLLSTLKNNP